MYVLRDIFLTIDDIPVQIDYNTYENDADTYEDAEPQEQPPENTEQENEIDELIKKLKAIRLQQVSGFDVIKAKKYGDAIIEILNQY